MKLHLSLRLLAASLVATASAAFAQGGGNLTIKVTSTFDYPGAASTLPQKVNDSGDIVGVYMDTSGFTIGFVRSSDGTFTQVVDPNDGANFTEGRGINDSGLVCGDYEDANLVFHGFFLDNGTYTTYDVQNSILTQVLGVNNAGDFAGAYDDSSGIGHGFVNVGGTIVVDIVIPGATNAPTYQLTDDDSFVGYYTGSDGLTHGYFQNRLGSMLKAPLDPAGSAGTILFGINNEKYIVGRYADSLGLTHGLLLKSNHFFTYDYPGASGFTSLNGINKHGVVVGRYVDSSGAAHGIIGRLTRSSGSDGVLREVPAAQPQATVVKAPVNTGTHLLPAL